MRVHRPQADELLSAAESAAVRSVLASISEQLELTCAGARLIWATCDAERAPAPLSVGAGRIVNLRAVYAVPTPVRLGLHAWTDTVEDVVDDGGVRVGIEAHEVEKVARMSTRQAWFPLALLAGAELMASHGVWAQLPERLASLVCRGAAQTLVDLGRGFAAEGAGADATRVGLGALRLARSGLLSLHAPGQFSGADDRTDASRLLAVAQAATDDCQLPTSPPGYDAVSAWLVGARLEERASS